MTPEPCLLCASRGRATPITADGRLCHGCRLWLGRALEEIVRLAAAAAAYLAPGAASRAPAAPTRGSRPPLNIDAVEPELALIELAPGDSSSAVPILEMLEMWERIVRDERGFLPYGPASLARAGAGESTLTGTVGFLRSEVEWMSGDVDFDLESFADHLRRATGVLRRWDADRERGVSRYRVPCPTIVEDGECGNVLIVTGSTDTYCRACQRTWEPARLLAVAGRDADIWLDSEAISAHLGIPIRTIQHWGKTGKIARRGMLYRLRDITDQRA
jgi:hypothetical protein